MRDKEIFKDLRIGVGNSLVQLITEMGFHYQINMSTKKKYYVHPSGNQLRLNFKHRRIAFLDKAGYKLGDSSFTTRGELESFSQHKLNQNA